MHGETMKFKNHLFPYIC